MLVTVVVVSEPVVKVTEVGVVVAVLALVVVVPVPDERVEVRVLKVDVFVVVTFPAQKPQVVSHMRA